MKRHLILTYLFLTVLLFGCNTKNTFDISKYDKAVENILNQYGGVIYAGNGSMISTKKGNTKYLSIKLSETLALQYNINPELILSHMAYEFYKCTDSESLKSYSEFQCILEAPNKNNEIIEFEKLFKISTLKLVSENKNILDKAMNNIIEQNSKELLNSITQNTLSKVESRGDDIPQILIDMNTSMGLNDSTVFRGFSYPVHSEESNAELLHLSGLMIGKSNRIYFSIDIDPYSDNSGIKIENFYFDQ